MPQQSIMTANDEQNQRAPGGFAWCFVFLFSSERPLPDFIFSFGQDRKAKIENLVPRSDGARWFWVDLACSLREAAERCCANFIAQPPSVTTARNTKVESFSLLR